MGITKMFICLLREQCPIKKTVTILNWFLFNFISHSFGWIIQYTLLLPRVVPPMRLMLLLAWALQIWESSTFVSPFWGFPQANFSNMNFILESGVSPQRQREAKSLLLHIYISAPPSLHWLL